MTGNAYVGSVVTTDGYKAAAVNAKIIAAGGTGLKAGDDLYWTSTEKDNNNTWYMVFDNGLAWYRWKHQYDPYSYVRACFAF